MIVLWLFFVRQSGRPHVARAANRLWWNPRCRGSCRTAIQPGQTKTLEMLISDADARASLVPGPPLSGNFRAAVAMAAFFLGIARWDRESLAEKPSISLLLTGCNTRGFFYLCGEPMTIVFCTPKSLPRDGQANTSPILALSTLMGSIFHELGVYAT